MSVANRGLPSNGRIKASQRVDVAPLRPGRHSSAFLLEGAGKEEEEVCGAGKTESWEGMVRHAFADEVPADIDHVPLGKLWGVWVAPTCFGGGIF